MTGFKVQNGRAIIADIDGIPQLSTCTLNQSANATLRVLAILQKLTRGCNFLLMFSKEQYQSHKKKQETLKYHE